VNTKGGHGGYTISIDGSPALESAQFAEAALTVERLSFRTGSFRTEPTRNIDRYDKRFPEALAGCDDPVPLAVYHVDDVTAKPQ
jgi:hypothetical protein